jgi:hypothetical protein
MLRPILMGLLALSMLGIQACGKSKDNGATVRSGYNGGAGRNGGVVTNNYSYALAPVNGANPQSVLSFLSVAMDPSSIGQIVSVQIAGQIKLGCSSASQPVIVNGANGVELRVTDSLAQQGEYAPIDTFMPVTSGTVLNGQMNLIFQDNYGSLRITGTYTPNNTGGTVSGTIVFQNSNGTSGTIGSFTMPIGNFLTCQ